MQTKKLTPAIGATISTPDFTQSITPETHDAIYEALLDHQVIFIRGASITPQAHLDFAKSFGQLDEPHPHYPHVAGYEKYRAAGKQPEHPT